MTTDPHLLVAKARGCLLALACGDALGGPIEFMGRAEITARHGRVTDFIGGGVFALRPGETTDDTAMTLDLARSLAELGRVDPEDIARRWVAWMRTGPKDIGTTTSEALGLIEDGTSWQEAGVLVDDKAEPYGGALGNGSIMRCAPLALFLHDSLDQLAQASIDTSRITHANPICEWSAAALNLIIAELLHGRHAGMVERVAQQIPEPDVREILEGVGHKDEGALRSSGHILHTLESALWAFGNSESLEEALVIAANLGEDTDTRAAVTGALAGAHYGENAIPSRWLEKLEGREELGTLAERLVAHAG